MYPVTAFISRMVSDPVATLAYGGMMTVIEEELATSVELTEAKPAETCDHHPHGTFVAKLARVVETAVSMYPRSGTKAQTNPSQSGVKTPKSGQTNVIDDEETGSGGM